MRIFCNYTHLTILSLLTVFINTSWTAEIKINGDALRDRNRKKLNSGFSKPVDQRISDIIAENALNFGHNMGIQLAALDPYATRSEIFSPLSLMTALSFLALGAKGRSYQQLQQVLGLNSDSEFIYSPNKYHEQLGLMLKDLQDIQVNNVRTNANWRYTKSRRPSIRISPLNHGPSTMSTDVINIANGLFVQNGYNLNPDYSKVLQSIYEAELTQLDFQTQSGVARDYINAWISKATFGKISQLIKGDIDTSTNVILASALYFKAFWETSFLYDSTYEEAFYPDGPNNPPVKVQMMRNADIYPFYESKEYDCRIIGLPYKGNETTMYVIQPNYSTRQKLRDLQQVLDAQKINGMIDNMKRESATLAFPKMKFTRSMHLKNVLKAMNLHDIFINGYSDLSLISQISQRTHLQTFTASDPISYESIYRAKPNEPAAFSFASRFGDQSNNTESFTKANDMSSIEMSATTGEPSITFAAQTSNKRVKRQVSNISSDPLSLALSNLESKRKNVESYRGDLYVDDVLHNVFLSVNEEGTEAAAATSALLLKTGTDVLFRADTPFLIIIRHDPTKLPLFYGIINKPEL